MTEDDFTQSENQDIVDMVQSGQCVTCGKPLGPIDEFDNAVATLRRLGYATVARLAEHARRAASHRKVVLPVKDASRIESALTAEDWQQVIGSEDNAALRDLAVFFLEGGMPYDVRAVAPTVAVLNYALPDSDPRKITREKIGMLRSSSGGGPYYPDSAEIDAMQRFLNALESYLPPTDG